MHYLHALIVGSLLLIPAVLLGQDIPPDFQAALKTEWNAEKIDRPPAREITFQHEATAVTQRLQKIDPQLIEQKFAASFTLLVRRADYRTLPKELTTLAYMRQRFLFNANYSQGDPGDETPTQQEKFVEMLKLIPPDRRPDDEHAAFFTKTELDNGYLVASIVQRQRDSIVAFRVLGPTEEVAEQRAATMLFILDNGLCRPIQQAMWKDREQTLAGLPAAQEKVVEINKRRDDLKLEREKLAAYTPEMKAALQLQRLESDSALADATARNAACDKLLAEKELGAEQRNAVINLKLAVQVELAGIEARRATQDKFLQGVEDATKLVGEMTRARDYANQLAAEPSKLLEQAVQRTKQVDAFAPLELVDDTVVIQPVKWSQ